jgi:hypothetical protein
LFAVYAAALNAFFSAVVFASDVALLWKENALFWLFG